MDNLSCVEQRHMPAEEDSHSPLGNHYFVESHALAEYNEGFLRPQQHSSLDARNSPDVPLITGDLNTVVC